MRPPAQQPLLAQKRSKEFVRKEHERQRCSEDFGRESNHGCFVVGELVILLKDESCVESQGGGEGGDGDLDEQGGSWGHCWNFILVGFE